MWTLSCVRAPLISVLLPAACVCWAPPAGHSRSQRYLRIPADKTIICSASPWFRASGCVWCLPLVSWLDKDGPFQIPLAPFVYFLPYHPTVCPDRPLFSELHPFALQFAANVEQSVPSFASMLRWRWLVSNDFSKWQKEHLEKSSNLIPALLNQSRKEHFRMRSLFW